MEREKEQTDHVVMLRELQKLVAKEREAKENVEHQVYIKRILGECLLVSSLPGKALRMLVDVARLAMRFNMSSQSRAW